MEELAAAGAGFETLVFLEYFEDLPDPRQRGKVMYPLDEVLLLALLAVLAGAETVVDIARFGAKKLTLLRRLRRFWMARHRTTIWMTSSPAWMLSTSIGVLWPGLGRALEATRIGSLPGTSDQPRHPLSLCQPNGRNSGPRTKGSRSLNPMSRLGPLRGLTLSTQYLLDIEYL